MRVAQLAKAAAVSADTVRHYTALGLLRPARDPHNGYQHYASSDLQRLRFIAHARRLGFSLKDVQSILARADSGTAPCGEVRDLLGERMLALVMRNALDEWADKPECAPDGQAICRLIDDFELPGENRPATLCPAH
ncbi:MerR family transcriptional regulator [Pseudomonas paeninsulae]|uniref:MerR family transcriptional regulator n=1 Tax=Pseudomonas paeninsulae TaxID=3110772 RepID=UPI002D79C6E9|nr:MerR family transcriptional regulator [Pseudomonas sp. IT1137]